MTEVTPFFQRNITCFHCGNDFKTTKIRSRFVKIKEHDTDFCPVYQSDEINPILYNVNVCVHCGFSFTDDFNRYIVPVLKDELDNKVTKHWKQQDYGNERSYEEAINTYKLAAYCAQIKKEKKLTIAGLYLRTAWLYRIKNHTDQEHRFMNMAVNGYIEAYLNDDFTGTSMSEVKLLYLIAEIHRRLGNFDQAVSYFSKVIEKQSTSVEPKIIEMAREQWYEMREEYKSMKTV